MKRIEMGRSRIEHIALEGDMKKPDMVRMSEVGPTIDNLNYQFTYEVPAWALSDDDVALLRDMSFTDAKVRVVLEIDE